VVAVVVAVADIPLPVQDQVLVQLVVEELDGLLTHFKLQQSQDLMQQLN
jgi:hypothetical protein